MAAHSLALGVAAVLVVSSVLAGGAEAADLTPVSQLREASASSNTVTTGFECLGPFPSYGCPVVLDNVSVLDVDTAPLPILSAFVTTASVASATATATHDSVVTVDAIVAQGSASAQGAMSELSIPPYLAVFVDSTRSTRDDVDVTFSLDAPTPFTFDASGSIVYPDPAFPLPWAVLLEITLTGPGGEIASYVVAPDYGCISDPETFECVVAPTPLSISGVLDPGTYTLDVTLTTMGSGTWLHSAGTVSGFSSGEYDVALLLDDVPSVPLAGGSGATLLGALLAGLGARRTRSGIGAIVVGSVGHSSAEGREAT